MSEIPITAVVNTQHEFWHREFGARIIEKNDNFFNNVSMLINQGIMPIIQIDSNFNEINELKSLPNNSFIAWLHSDEKYDLKFNKAIIAIPGVKGILRPYKLRRFSHKNLAHSLKFTLANLIELRTTKELIKVFLWTWRGIGMIFRQQLILLMHKFTNVKYVNFPIGYTNIFAKSFIGLLENTHLTIKGSLILEDVFEKEKSRTKIGFVGQSGQIIRETSIRALELVPGSNVIRRSHYGASNVYDDQVIRNGIEYVATLFESDFILAPPGNISGESYRIYECVVSQAIPIFKNVVTSDPLFISEFLSLGLGNYRWRTTFTLINGIGKDEINVVKKRNLVIAKNGIERARNELRSLQN